jgi:protein-disulfide isomerase
MLNRRSLLSLSAGLLASGFSAHPALSQTTLASKLLEPGPLPDKVFGAVDAPVTVIEYASLTCHHCMNFHIKTWPAFKAKYVDTGKVRFIVREFPLDPLSTAGFMLARCSDDAKWYPIVDMLYKTQEGWAHSPKPLDALTQTMKQAGFTQETVEACLRRDDLFQGVKQVQERGSKEFGVNSTPTFFVNGEKKVGALTIDEFDKILAPLLAGR